MFVGQLFKLSSFPHATSLFADPAGIFGQMVDIWSALNHQVVLETVIWHPFLSTSLCLTGRGGFLGHQVSARGWRKGRWCHGRRMWGCFEQPRGEATERGEKSPK